MAEFVPLIVLVLLVVFVVDRIRNRRRSSRESLTTQVRSQSRTSGPKQAAKNSNLQTGTDSPSIANHSQSVDSRQRSERTRSMKRTEAHSCWISHGQTTRVHGIDLEGGLIYVGRDLKAPNGYHLEPSLIDLSKPVDMKRPDHNGDGMGYWPSYEQIPPKSRGAYLSWLADGRRSRDACIGYVFLFLYGLERRALYEIRDKSGFGAELEVIRDEVEKLLVVYGENRSFNGYASRFLSALALLCGIGTDRLPLLPNSPGGDLPLVLKVALGKLVATQQPIPPAWAHAWVQHDGEISLRTPARRCPDLFSALFQHLYRHRYGDGMSIKPNKTVLVPRYWPASPGFSGGIDLPIETNLRDVTKLKWPRNALAEIANEATDMLDPYSRHIGKNNHAGDSLQAIALLPAAVANERKYPALGALRRAITPYFAESARPAVPMSLLLEHFAVDQEDRLSKKEAVLLAQILEKLDLGIAPDVRFGGLKPKPSDHVVLFDRGKDAPTAPSPAYKAAALMIRLATMVSTADGDVAADERRALDTHIDSHQILSDGERTRLHAYKDWLLAHDEGTAGLKAQLDILSESQVESLGEYLITIAAADGHIDRDEIKMLEKLYKRLGLDPARVMTALHNASSEPVTVRPAGQPRGFAIPKPDATDALRERRDRPVESLDMAALERKLADTERVSALLSGIFSEGKEDASGDEALANATTSITANTTADLDPAHSAILLALGSKNTWARSELETLVEQQGLLVDGALDTINEAAFDHCDAPCVDEYDDTYTLDREVYEELTA